MQRALNLTSIISNGRVWTGIHFLQLRSTLSPEGNLTSKRNLEKEKLSQTPAKNTQNLSPETTRLDYDLARRVWLVRNLSKDHAKHSRPHGVEQ